MYLPMQDLPMLCNFADHEYFKERLDFGLEAIAELNTDTCPLDDLCFLLESCLIDANTLYLLEACDEVVTETLSKIAST